MSEKIELKDFDPGVEEKPKKVVQKVEDPTWPKKAFIVSAEMADDIVVKGTYRSQYDKLCVVYLGGAQDEFKAVVRMGVMVAQGGSFYLPEKVDFSMIAEDFVVEKEAPKGFKHIRRKVN